jgi:hypothetical protein
VSESGKKYCYKTHNGEKGIRIYESGAEWDEISTKLVKPLISSENAVMMQQKGVEAKYEKRERAVVKAVEDGMDVSNLDIDDADALLGYVITRDIVLNQEAADNARVSGYKTVLQATNRWPDRVRQETPGVVNNFVVLGGEDAKRLQQLIGDVVDAEYSENDG